MRRAIAAVLVVTGLLGTAPLAEAKPGPPQSIRVARPVDALPRPSQLWEEWTVLLADPRSHRRVTFHVMRGSDGNEAKLLVYDGQYSATAERGAFPAPAGRAAWRLSPEDSASLRHGAGGWRLRVESADGSANIRLASPLPGVTAGRWRLGIDRTGVGPVHQSWSSPVASSRASGFARAHDRSARLDGWRGTVIHRWGYFSRNLSVWNHELTATSQRAGSGWLLFGLNRNNHPNETLRVRDRRWMGVLVRATPSGTGWCRPRITRRGWLYNPQGTFAADLTVARCGARRIAFTRPRGPADLRGQVGWEENTIWGTSKPRGTVLLRHVGIVF